jgi:anti-sigma-K factor RskA
MTHDEVQNHLEEYLLGDLPDDLDKAISQHLEECEDCRQALADLDTASVALALHTPQVAVPDGLKSRILQHADISGSETVSPGPRKRISRLWRPLTIAAAIAVIAIGAYAWVLRNKVNELEQQLAETQDVTEILRAPGMKFLDLAGVAPNESAFGKVVIDAERGTAAVYMYRLPETPEGMTYQLWVTREGKPTSAGMFTVGKDGMAMLTLNDLPDEGKTPSFLVTIEPAGGQPLPTGMMYLTGPSDQQTPSQ